MPLDPSIIMQLKTPQIMSGQQRMENQLQMESLRQGNQENAMKMQAYRDKQDEDNNLKSILRGGDEKTLPDRLMQGGYYDQSNTVQKNNADRAIQQSTIAANKKALMMEAMGRDSLAIYNDPSPANVHSIIDQAVKDGHVTEEQAQQAHATVSNDPAENKKTAWANYQQTRPTKDRGADIEFKNAMNIGQPQAPNIGQPQAPIAPQAQGVPSMQGQPQAPQGAFKGDPQAIIAEINRIRDPNEKAAAMQAYQSQINGMMGGQQPTQQPTQQAPMQAPQANGGFNPPHPPQQIAAMNSITDPRGKALAAQYQHENDRAQTEWNRNNNVSADARFQVENRQERAESAPVLVMNPSTNKPMYVNRSDAIGKQPYSSADDAKQISLNAKEDAKKEGASIVDSNISLLRDAYSKLNEGDGITSTNKRVGSNIAGALGKSSVGQYVGGALGTENQTQRDIIAQTRPLLLQSIMRATGMSAKQMDSNAELKLWLATATDPSKSLQANQAALNNIERMYGSGAANGSINNNNVRTANPSNNQVDYHSKYGLKGK